MGTDKEYVKPATDQVFLLYPEAAIATSDPNELPGTNWDAEEKDWDIWG